MCMMSLMNGYSLPHSIHLWAAHEEPLGLPKDPAQAPTYGHLTPCPLALTQTASAPHPAQEPGLLALAMCAALGDLATKRAALDAIPRVCRTATTLFTFLSLLKVGVRGAACATM